MLWSEILSLKAWTPLSQIDYMHEKVCEGLYMVGQGAFLRTQPHNRNFEKDDPDVPFVTKAYWASSIDAVKYVVLRDYGYSTCKVIAMPPRELLFETSGQYSDLLKKIPVHSAKAAERAIYSNAGKFLYKLITIDRLNFCFLGSAINGNEQVFLIEVSLIK